MHKPGLGPFGFPHIFPQGVIYFRLGRSSLGGEVGCELGSQDESVMGDLAFRHYGDVTAGSSSGVEPEVVGTGQVEGEFVILPVVAAYQDGDPVG